MPMTEEIKEYLADKRKQQRSMQRDFIAAGMYVDDLVLVKELDSVDAYHAFLLLNKWRKFSSSPRFIVSWEMKPYIDNGWLDVPETTKRNWGLSEEQWQQALAKLIDAELIEVGVEQESQRVLCRLCTDFPKRPSND